MGVLFLLFVLFRKRVIWGKLANIFIFPNELPIFFLFCHLSLGILYFSVQPLICYQTRMGFYPKSGALFCKVELWIGVPDQLIQSQFPISRSLTIGNSDTMLAEASLANSEETYEVGQ